LDADTLGFRGATLTLYRGRSHEWTPVWELRGPWSPRFTIGDLSVVVSRPDDLVGVCALSTGRLLWTTAGLRGAVWRPGSLRGVASPTSSGGQFVGPESGHIETRYDLPRPHVHGLVGDVLVVRDA